MFGHKLVHVNILCVCACVLGGGGFRLRGFNSSVFGAGSAVLATLERDGRGAVCTSRGVFLLCTCRMQRAPAAAVRSALRVAYRHTAQMINTLPWSRYGGHACAPCSVFGRGESTLSILGLIVVLISMSAVSWMAVVRHVGVEHAGLFKKLNWWLSHLDAFENAVI